MAQLEITVRTIARRLGLRALLCAGVVHLSLGLGLATLLVLAQRLLSFAASPPLLALAPPLAAALIALAVGLSRWPHAEDAALRADARLNLQERLTSAVTTGAGPMPSLVRADAERRAAAINVERAFPLRWPRRAAMLPLLAAALVVGLLMPPLDLLGWQAARRTRATERQAARDAARGAREDLASLASAARNQGRAAAAQALAEAQDRAAAALQADDPRQIQREAARAERQLQDALNGPSAAASADPGERELLRRALRTVENWTRQLGGPTPDAADGKVARSPAPPEPSPFIREQSRPSEPEAPSDLERKLLEAGDAAEAALAREPIPWRYRAVVRRYFSSNPSRDQP